MTMNILKTAVPALLLLAGHTALAADRDITLTTDDGVAIRATVSSPEYSRPVPAVVLIHQGGSSRKEWVGIVPRLVERGYLVVAYDIRGHGESDAVDSIWSLFNDPDQAPRDLRAVLRFLASRPDVDKERIAVVGASIGANLAAMASSEMNVATAVAISGKTSAVYNLAGKQALDMKSVFYIASAGDQGGKRAQWAQELYQRTGEPRRLEIVAQSNRHGVGVFDDSPATLAAMLSWLDQTLGQKR